MPLYLHRNTLRSQICVDGGQAQKVPLQELDWLVCNSGADIWHATAAGGDASKVAWSADERWEDHIDFRHVVAVK